MNQSDTPKPTNVSDETVPISIDGIPTQFNDCSHCSSPTLTDAQIEEIKNIPEINALLALPEIAQLLKRSPLRRLITGQCTDSHACQALTDRMVDVEAVLWRIEMTLRAADSNYDMVGLFLRMFAAGLLALYSEKLVTAESVE